MSDKEQKAEEHLRQGVCQGCNNICEGDCAFARPIREAYLAGYEKGYAEGRKEVIRKIKELLCKKDEDYDMPIISPKFLNDYLDDISMFV